jgi:hypothetical protein
MSSNREIPRRVILADQVNGSAVDIVATDLEYFDSVTPEGTDTSGIGFYGGGIFSYYTEGEVLPDKVINAPHAGKFIASLDLLPYATLAVEPTGDVSGATVNAKVYRDGDLMNGTDFPGFVVPSATSIDITSNVIEDIDISNVGAALEVGDRVSFAVSGGRIDVIITKEMLQIAAGYHEAAEDQVTTMTIPAGTPVYGRFSKITLPSGTNLGSVVITNG